MNPITNQRDDRFIEQSISPFVKALIGITYYIPSSGLKKSIFHLLGAKIGQNVYFGPGSLLISNNYSNIHIMDGAFIGPGVTIYANKLTIGENSTIGYQSLFVGDNLVIGAHCNISNRTFIESSYAPVIIENEVTLGASVIISSHDGAYKQTYGKDIKSGPVIIRWKSFIGNNAIILPGIEIGKQAIVGAGAVVTKNVEEMTVVGGVPARKIKSIT